MTVTGLRRAVGTHRLERALGRQAIDAKSGRDPERRDPQVALAAYLLMAVLAESFAVAFDPNVADTIYLAGSPTAVFHQARDAPSQQPNAQRLCGNAALFHAEPSQYFCAR